ncbi:DUF3916 domain-containing protein [Metasolibacillus meyeri]|uniref:DUF3916 domain-containing protein n=1 Tax=Metasolibacillus meyeri TaxID=1071052 RepID=A0AAW9NYU0_9BACL|nr:DUF3916 domain-containing protein [Metasolibacillus meyeri]MEC1180708.1 DUF3916 domain-containing protein [Metasolibacillus meyeri]
MKKQRGLARKVKNITSKMNENTQCFPTAFYNDEYYNYPLPVSRELLQSSKTLQIQIAHLLVERTLHLIHIKPDNQQEALVTLLLKPNDMWNSQIVVHKNKESYCSFYKRNTIFQQWLLFKNSEKLVTYFSLENHTDLQAMTIEERIVDAEEKQVNYFLVIGEVISELFNR